jgi:hypothetical protein
MPDRERQLEEARRRLQETERCADQTLERAAKKLRERTEEQEATAERLRKEAREGPELRRDQRLESRQLAERVERRVHPKPPG